MGNYSLYYHFYILLVGEDAHTATGQRWISARKPIHNNEICGGSKEGRSQVNPHSCSLYTGAHLGNHKIFPLFSLLARLSGDWSQSCPATPRHTSGHWRQQPGLCQFPPVLPLFQEDKRKIPATVCPSPANLIHLCRGRSTASEYKFVW